MDSHSRIALELRTSFKFCVSTFRAPVGSLVVVSSAAAATENYASFSKFNAAIIILFVSKLFMSANFRKSDCLLIYGIISLNIFISLTPRHIASASVSQLVNLFIFDYKFVHKVCTTKKRTSYDAYN